MSVHQPRPPPHNHLFSLLTHLLAWKMLFLSLIPLCLLLGVEASHLLQRQAFNTMEGEGDALLVGHVYYVAFLLIHKCITVVVVVVNYMSFQEA